MIMVVVVVDRLTKYAHFIGLIFTSQFWQEFFKQQGVAIATFYCLSSTNIYRQSKVVNRCLETYLRYMARQLPHTWFQWLSLTEYWYNTSSHSAFQQTPYKVLYGVPPIYLPYFPSDSSVLAVDVYIRDREETIMILKNQLGRAAQKMKLQANKH